MPASTPRIIKRGSAHARAETTYNFIDLRQRCEDYAAEIRRQCKSWIVEARGECDAIRESARREGFAAGRDEGLKSAAEEIDTRAAEEAARRTQASLATAAPAVRAAAKSLEAQRRQWQSEWELTAVQLAVEIAGRLTRQQIAANPALILDRAREVLALASGHGDASLRMHPADLDALGEQADALTDGTAATLVPDPTVEAGGCVLQTDAGQIDAQLSTQLDRLVEELLA